MERKTEINRIQGGKWANTDAEISYILLTTLTLCWNSNWSVKCLQCSLCGQWEPDPFKKLPT